MLKFLCLLFGLVLPAVTATAQTYYGRGDTSCGSWNQERAAGSVNAIVYQQWIAGFISGVNTGDVINKRPDFLRHTEPAQILTDIDDYCSSQPNKTLVEAAIAVIITLRKNASS